MLHTISLKELRNTIKIAELCHSSTEPVFIKDEGYTDLVIMSMETFERIRKTADIDNAIASSEAEMTADEEAPDAKDTFSSLRGKHFGSKHRR